MQVALEYVKHQMQGEFLTFAERKLTTIPTQLRVTRGLNKTLFPNELAQKFVRKCGDNKSRLQTVELDEIDSLTRLSQQLKSFQNRIPDLNTFLKFIIGEHIEGISDDIQRPNISEIEMHLFLELLTKSSIEEIVDELDALVQAGKHEEASLLATFMINSLRSLSDRADLPEEKTSLQKLIEERFNRVEKRLSRIQLDGQIHECLNPCCISQCMRCGRNGSFYVVYNSDQVDSLDFLKLYGEMYEV